MKYSRRAILIHNLDRHVFVIYLTSYALPLLQRLSFNCWWSSVTSETSAARDSIECFIHRSVVNCESFRVSTSSSSTISSPLSWSDSLRFSQENCKIRSFVHSSVSLSIFFTPYVSKLSRKRLLFWKRCNQHLFSSSQVFIEAPPIVRSLDRDISWPARIPDTIDYRHPAGWK